MIFRRLIMKRVVTVTVFLFFCLNMQILFSDTSKEKAKPGILNEQHDKIKAETFKEGEAPEAPAITLNKELNEVEQIKKDYYNPWYTGPLIAPSATIVPSGKVNIQPYLYYFNNFGQYNNHGRYQKVQSTLVIEIVSVNQFGLTDRMDTQVTVEAFYKYRKQQKAFRYGDTNWQVGFQLLKSDDLYWWKPDLKFIVGETFPTGQYQKLNPNKLSTDSSGAGSFQTSVGIAYQKTFYKVRLYKGQYNPFRVRSYSSYTFPSKVRVRGFNTYGGGFGTDGKVTPGGIFTNVSSVEYSLSQRWVLALDGQMSINAATHYKGDLGSNIGGGEASMGSGSSDQFSLAPALEYNVSSTYGWIAGAWFTIGGRNNTDFVTALLSFTVLF